MYITNTHTHRKHTWHCLCVSDPSGLVYFSCRAADEWRAEGYTATRTHGNSPSTLSATTLFILHIYLSVQQRPGKSLTHQPPWSLSTTDQRERERDYLCATVWDFESTSLASFSNYLQNMLIQTLSKYILEEIKIQVALCSLTMFISSQGILNYYTTQIS